MPEDEKTPVFDDTQDPDEAEARDRPNRGYGRVGKRLRLAAATVADKTPFGFDENVADELDLED